MKLTNEQTELLAMATAALDLGFDMNELDTSNVRSLRMSIEHSPIYYELYNMDNRCPIEVETPYWEEHFSNMSIDKLDAFQKSILNI